MSEIEFDFSNVAGPPTRGQELVISDVCAKGKNGAEYIAPATRSASKRWKRIHEQSMMLRLNEMHVIKKQNACMSKEAARKIIRKIPVEILAKEWLSKEDATVDMRAFLVDHVLPTLILGVERLLKEVDEKGLSSTNRFEPDFNPINFLAQYLMRNNPRYSNFAEASPYVRGLREVSEELKQELFTFEDNRLARIKAEARRKRTEREKIEQLLKEEKERRQAQLLVQFREWNVPTDNNRVELSLLQNALMSFAEIAEQLPDELKEVAKFGHPLEPVDETGRTLAVKEFAQYISLFVEDLPVEVFEQFMVHMSKCAAAHRASAERENRRIILTNLFILCDHGGYLWTVLAHAERKEFQIGILDRHRILTLFEQYWDMMKERKEITGTLRNPRRWPVVEVDEVDDIMFDDLEEEEGGLSKAEEKVAHSQLAQARRDLNREHMHANAHDKIGQEKWKMELLSERSEEQASTVADEEKMATNVEEEGEKNIVQMDSQTAGEPEAANETQAKEEQTGEKKETLQEPLIEGPGLPDVAAATTSAEEVAEEVKTDQAEGEKQEETQTMREADGQGQEKSDEVEVKKVEGETTTEDDVTKSGLAETSDDVTINVPVLGGNSQEKAVENLDTGKDESVAETQEEFDVDITGEMAGRLTKSALKPPDPATQPTATGRASVTFAGNTAFDREKTGLTTQSRSQSQMSAFDESILNVSQFVQLTETFLGHHPTEQIFQKMVHFLKGGYEETEEEKMERLVKARKEAISAKRKLMMDNLFEKWDNDGSCFLEMEDVQEVMLKYKDGQEHDSIKRAQSNLRKRSKYHDMRLSRREFRQFVELVVDELPGAESFEFFVEFLTNSVERSYAERIRGEARKKWLSQILIASQTCGTNMDAVYKAVFHALYKDEEAHGGEKKISANISMLERNTIDPSRGDLCLRYAACTPEDCQYLLGKVLFQNQKGISWTAVESGKPVHVPRVANHGNIYFWNFDRLPEDREGSFIVVPLADLKKRVFGILGIDTMLDIHKKAIFITHEIQFFQGVAKSFSIAYHNVDMRRKLLRITESAISWIQRRCPHIVDISVYIVEPNTKTDGDPVLRKMMTTDKKGAAVQVTEIIRLERKDNLFRDYLFKCMDNSETVTADAYGQRHTASPLRDSEGKAIGVVDISIGSMRKLPLYENKEAQRMLRLLQQAHRELTKEAEGEDTTRILEAEQDDDSRMDIMFDRLMLMELRENVARLDHSAFAELKSYNEPPHVIHDIIRATLAIFHLEKAIEGMFEDWTVTKNYITPDLIQQIKTYDPTVATELVKSEQIERYLKAVPHGAVAKHGSTPAQQLYNWVFVCISLIDHTRKMRENAEGNVMVVSGEDADGAGAAEGTAAAIVPEEADEEY